MVQSFSTLVDNWLIYDSVGAQPMAFVRRRSGVHAGTCGEADWPVITPVIYMSIINRFSKTSHHFEEE